ncbi:hypothetical protein BDV96DRAFT_202321 [Lophiotrema nucula]|uniref:F-box domain-containing protein n=1 Tax=Lophiotrema nucula TaxID=690887 RepID=A0A6A5YUM1_9PLEO|nr:hypothetical protein BDV96DRAFT_202321 [Lophiotrema nucula]
MPSRLPAELRLAVLEQLEPEDCFNFAITSKESWRISESLVRKHGKLFEELRVVETVRGERTVWNLLDRILDDPSTAKYVREIQLDVDRALCYDLGVQDPILLTRESARLPSETAARYDKACEEFCYDWFWDVPTINGELATGPDASPEFVNAKGSDSAVIATLLSMLPKLHTLRYTAGGEDYWLLHAFRCVARDVGPALPFQSLRNVSIAHYGTEGCMRWAWVHCIIRIPSMRSFTGNMIGGCWDEFPDDEDLLRSPPDLSGVTDLTFGYSNVEALAMDAIVRQCRDLKTFRYSNGGSSVAFEAYDPRYFIYRLWQYRSNTLEQLILEDDSDENRAEDTEAPLSIHPVYSLRTFEKLKSFACDLKDIVTGNEKDIMKELKKEEFQHEGITINTNNCACIFNVRALFPKSLEELHIGCNDFQLSLEDRIALLYEVLKSKERVLPNLKLVYLPVQESAELEEFKARAAAAGVEYKPISLVGKYDDIYRSV